MAVICSHEYTISPIQDHFHMHTHNMYEILYFMEGDAYFFIEGSSYHMSSGDLLVIRKGESHHLILRSQKPYKRIVAHFDDLSLTQKPLAELLTRPFDNRPLGKYNHYEASVFPNNRWQYHLERLYNAKSNTQQEFLLLPLLFDLNDAFTHLEAEKNTLHLKNKTAKIIEYINTHLPEDLSISILCERFYISSTHLNRLFRQSTGASVWEYIITKRLFLAKEKLQHGIPPTSVYTQCGFHDYATFYRAYKNHFSSSPKSDFKRN